MSRYDELFEKVVEAIENGISLDDFIQDDEMACMCEEVDESISFIFEKARRFIVRERFAKEKRTRDEIITAMKCIASDMGVKGCIGESCPYDVVCAADCDCEKFVMRDALTLIE